MRRDMFLLPVLAATLCLSACGDKPMSATSAPSAPAAAAPTPQPAVSAEAVRPGQNDMIKECRGMRLQLTALPSQDATSTRTRVDMEREGQRQTLPAPAEMAEYTPVGIGCAEDGKGTAYAVVQYGELPYGCEFCEWFFLYDATGKLLNHATPPLLEQDGQQSPNNDDYEHMLEQLGLKHPELLPFQS
ncbi:hypothetical protein VC179_004270 [Xanthomonas sp. WHRI 8812E]|nr:hypothetical protein [Xanthomonas sp. WHRI 8812E]